MKFIDNLYCVNCELIHWDYDENGRKFPISYGLTFTFYGTDVTAYIITEELQNGGLYVHFTIIDTDGELAESFEEVFENNEFRDKVCKICENCWNNSLDSNNYNYKGELIQNNEYFYQYLRFVRIVNILDHGVIGNTVDFDSAIAGSNPAGPTCYCFQ